MSNCPLDEVRMETCPILSCVLKRLAGFTLAGFAVVILAGPVLSALLSSPRPFAATSSAAA